MVCDCAVDGFLELLPMGANTASAISSALAPEIRITAKPPSPMGVAIAVMVSSIICVGLARPGSRFSSSSSSLVLDPGRTKNSRARTRDDDADEHEPDLTYARNYPPHF